MDVYGYDILIKQFLNQEISVEVFERRYIDKFLKEKSPLSRELYEILNWLFGEVDAYTYLPLEEGDDPDEHLDEDQLRASAQKALDQLKALKDKT